MPTTATNATTARATATARDTSFCFIRESVVRPGLARV
jgi:hypothetical protein